MKFWGEDPGSNSATYCDGTMQQNFLRDIKKTALKAVSLQKTV